MVEQSMVRNRFRILPCPRWFKENLVIPESLSADLFSHLAISDYRKAEPGWDRRSVLLKPEGVIATFRDDAELEKHQRTDMCGTNE